MRTVPSSSGWRGWRRPNGTSEDLGADRGRVVLALLLSLNVLSVTIAPSFGWYLFCGFCMALSIIAPGMSFSTLLMPLGLYTPWWTALATWIWRAGARGHWGRGHHCVPGQGHQRAVYPLLQLRLPRHCGHCHRGHFGHHPLWELHPRVGTAVANIVCLVVGVVAAWRWISSTRACPKSLTGRFLKGFRRQSRRAPSLPPSSP